MLADNINIVLPSGKLDPDIHARFTSKLGIVNFIAEVLPQWRDDPERPNVEAEDILSEYLCSYLNDASYYSEVWSHIKFQTETVDETHRNRTIDLTVKPRDTTILAGQRYCRYDALFPIECKRLPTPKGTQRDEREYVFNEYRTSGGIQRFKFGYHGATHTFAAMIAYVQEQSCSHWRDQVNGWIRGLAAEPNSVWNDSDILQLLSDNLETGISTLKSEHKRVGDLEVCALRHLWIIMKKPD